MAIKKREMSDDEWIIRIYGDEVVFIHPDEYKIVKELQEDEKKLLEFIQSHPKHKSDSRGRPSDKAHKYTLPEYIKLVKDVEELVEKGKAKDKRKACEILFKEGKYPSQKNKTNIYGVYNLYRNIYRYLKLNHYYDEFPY